MPHNSSQNLSTIHPTKKSPLLITLSILFGLTTLAGASATAYLSTKLQSSNQIISTLEKSSGTSLKDPSNLPELIPKPTDTKDTPKDNNTPPTVENPADYLYFKDWGIKIRLTDNLQYFSHFFINDQNTRVLYLNAALKSSSSQDISSFINVEVNAPTYISEHSLVAISAITHQEYQEKITNFPSTKENLDNSIVFKNQKYLFTAARRNGAERGTTKSAIAAEQNAANALRDLIHKNISNL